jgi:SOS response regulatory protein OraA/RecX
LNDSLARSIRSLALKLLARRDYSRLQLKKKLQEKIEQRRHRFTEGDAARTIQSVLKSLEASGLINDSRFAGNLAWGSRCDRLFGNARIRRDLRHFGIDAKITDSILSEIPDESEALDKAVRHYVHRRGEPASLGDLQRVYRYGVRLGHRPSEVRRRLEVYFRRLKK